MGGNFAQAGTASVEIKSVLKKMGIAPEDVRRISIAVYEAEMNVVLYARKGILSLQVSPERVLFIVEDEGDGIEDVSLAMCEGYTTSDERIRELGFGSGMGLPNIRNNADFLKVASALNKGTRLEAGFDLAGRCKEDAVEEKETKDDAVESASLYVYRKRG